MQTACRQMGSAHAHQLRHAGPVLGDEVGWAAQRVAAAEHAAEGQRVLQRTLLFCSVGCMQAYCSA
jgi:hypothetical protein